MKRTGFQQKPRKPLKGSPFKRKTLSDINTQVKSKKAKKATTKPKKVVRIAGYESTKELKIDIQALLRKIVIIRDGGCVLRHFPKTGACGSYTKAGNLILQAEHLNSRTHSGSFGDVRNIICLCQRHHIYWKPQNSDEYWKLIKEIIPKSQWDWYKRAKADNKAYKVDWKLVKLALEQDLKKLEN